MYHSDEYPFHSCLEKEDEKQASSRIAEKGTEGVVRVGDDGRSGAPVPEKREGAPVAQSVSENVAEDAARTGGDYQPASSASVKPESSGNVIKGKACIGDDVYPDSALAIETVDPVGKLTPQVGNKAIEDVARVGDDGRSGAPVPEKREGAPVTQSVSENVAEDAARTGGDGQPAPSASVKPESSGNVIKGKVRIGDDVYPDLALAIETVDPVGKLTPQVGNMATGGAPLRGEDQLHPKCKDSPDQRTDDCDTTLDSVSWFRPICFAIVAIVMVWVMRLFLPLIQAIAESSGMMRALYLLMLALPVGVIVYAIWAAVRIFMSLPPGINCKFTDYKSGADKKALRDELVKKYLLGFQRNESLKRFLGNTAASVDSLCTGVESDIDKWFEGYKAFQDALKNKAGKVRTKYANAIALFTITSPKFQLDIIVTLFFSTRMVLAIARIFNKRMTKIGALRLTISWAMNLYLAGELQNIGAKVGGILGRSVDSLLTLLGVPFAKTAKQIVSATVSLGIEGGVNKKLATLLGDKAIKEFVAVKGL